MNQNRGLTLLELLIAMAVIGILAAIAYPAYSSYVLRGHRADAMRVLTDAQGQLERCYAQTFNYSNCAVSWLPSSYYQASMTAATASGYALSATASGAQTGDGDCASFSLDQAGTRTASNTQGAANTACWGR